ncbi:uncharacterized protein LOC119961692 isoform X4 [Scyliorhinus canicula]|uniref:uncharacterized protein LOC119961692 isoform X4 n=1 Tax=Scyliorhinus canicula TaxID=7830 RepID=UPI0018F77B56|nr:uncharacterized protein LOC119961692 isoform X4 [Scyliorhinus canicula]
MRSITFLGALPVRERFIFLQLGALKIVISSNSSASDIFPAAGPAGGFKFENGEIVPEMLPNLLVFCFHFRFPASAVFCFY